MTLAALIAAYHEADEPGGGLRATLPLAGRTLLERQARIAAGAGADLIVVAVEKVPRTLATAVDRLRSQGLRVTVARTAAEAAEAVHPDDRLLLVADGLIATETHIDRLAAFDGPAILTVPDVRVDDRYERIDAQSRWAGLAILDGDMLKRTAEMLGDWDLQSTLLRRAVQSGARQLSLRGEPADEQLIVAERENDLAELQRRIFESASAHRGDWVSRYLLAPLEQAATRALMPGNVSPTTLNLAEMLLTLLALLAWSKGWPWLGLAFLLLATPLDGIAERLAALRMQEKAGATWWSYLLPTLSAAALIALAFSLVPLHSWGCISVAAAAIGFQVAHRIEDGGRSLPGGHWLAERKGMAWLLLPFAAAGLWITGLSALAAYAAGSFFWVQRQVHRSLGRPPQD